MALKGFEIDRLFVSVGLDRSAFEKGIVGLQKNMRAAGMKLQSAGRSMSTVITLPIVAAGVAAIKLGTDFESSLSKIQNLVGKSEEQVAAWREEILKLAPAVGIGPTALSDALFVVTSAGADASEALDIVELAAKASAIGMGEAEEIARAVTATMAAYSKEGLTAADATDILTATVKAGNLEASQLAPALGRVIGIAAEMGVSFQEVGANVAVFTKLGVSAAEAVTGLKTTLSLIQKPSSEAEKQAKALGISFAGIRKSIREQGLQKTLVGLVKITEGNETAMAQLFGSVEALASVLGTSASQGEVYAEVLADISDATGIVDEGFENVSGTSAQKFKEILATLQVVGIRLEKSMRPAIDKIVEVVQKVVDWFSNLDDKTVDLIVQIGLLAAVMGPLAIGIGAVMAILSPWMLAIAGVTAAVAFMILNWDEVVAFVNDKIPLVGDAFVLIWNVIKWAVKGIWEAFKFQFGLLWDLWELIWNQMLAAWDIFAGIFTGDWERVWGGIKDTFSNIWDFVRGTFESAIDFIVSLIPDFLKDWLGLTDDVSEGAEDMDIALGDTTTAMADLAEQMAGGTTEAAEDVTLALEDTTGAIEDTRDAATETAGLLSGEGGLIEVLGDASEKVRELEEELGKQGGAISKIEALGTMSVTTSGFLVDMSGAATDLRDVFGEISTDIDTNTLAIAASVKRMADNVSDSIEGTGEGTGGISGVLNRLQGSFDNIAAVLNGSVTDAIAMMANIIVPGLGSAFLAVVNILEGFGIDVDKIFEDILNTVVDFLGTITGFGGGISDRAQANIDAVAFGRANRGSGKDPGELLDQFIAENENARNNLTREETRRALFFGLGSLAGLGGTTEGRVINGVWLSKDQYAEYLRAIDVLRQWYIDRGIDIPEDFLNNLDPFAAIEQAGPRGLDEINSGGVANPGGFDGFGEPIRDGESTMARAVEAGVTAALSKDDVGLFANMSQTIIVELDGAVLTSVVVERMPEEMRIRGMGEV